MMRLDTLQIARLTGGRIYPPGARAVVSGVATDSRTLQAGELFIPLRGPRFDGHDFLAQAVQRGAAACLSEEVVTGLPVPVIGVDDTLTALGDLAAGVRQGFDGPVAAVTGSAGKTTTKDMLAAVLAGRNPGLATDGNFNNLIGLPLTLLRLDPLDRWVVVEMGMSARGEIARLAAIARPSVGIITNVGAAHLEELATLAGVARAKGELFAALPAGGTAVVNADDERVRQLPVANGVRRLLYGLAAEAAVRAEQVQGDGEGVSFRLCLPEGCHPVRLAVAGRHNVHNALAAAAGAVALGVAVPAIVAGLEAFRPRAGRMDRVLLADEVVLFDDSYNANPLSVQAALQTLAESGGRQKFAVLGDMLELGADAATLHRETGRAAARCVQGVIALGPLAPEVVAGARAGGLPADRVAVAADHAAALALLQRWLQPGDRVLVKGSRGMRMERISAALRAAAPCLKAGNS